MKDSTPPERRVTLAPTDDGTLVAMRPRRTYRFLLSDGTTVDVVTDRDDSDVRAAVVAETGVERIEGVVVLPDEYTPPPPAPPARRSKRSTTDE